MWPYKSSRGDLGVQVRQGGVSEGLGHLQSDAVGQGTVLEAVPVGVRGAICPDFKSKAGVDSVAQQPAPISARETCSQLG